MLVWLVCRQNKSSFVVTCEIIASPYTRWYFPGSSPKTVNPFHVWVNCYLSDRFSWLKFFSKFFQKISRKLHEIIKQLWITKWYAAVNLEQNEIGIIGRFKGGCRCAIPRLSIRLISTCGFDRKESVYLSIVSLEIFCNEIFRSKEYDVLSLSARLLFETF